MRTDWFFFVLGKNTCLLINNNAIIKAVAVVKFNYEKNS